MYLARFVENTANLYHNKKYDWDKNYVWSYVIVHFKYLKLSKNRAAAVKQLMTSQFKINESRIEVTGKGESEPISDNTTPEGKAQNRRVEFIKI